MALLTGSGQAGAAILHSSSPPLKNEIRSAGALGPAGQPGGGGGVARHPGHAGHAVQLEVEVGEAALLEGGRDALQPAVGCAFAVL